MTTKSNQAAMTATRALIVPANADGAFVSIENAGPDDVYIGGADVTAGNGYELQKGEHFETFVGPNEEIYGVCKTGETSTACYFMTMRKEQGD